MSAVRKRHQTPRQFVQGESSAVAVMAERASGVWLHLLDRLEQ
jgi:hypothetical protein